MCGIAGIFNLKDNPPVSLQKLKRMIYIQKHRGPDQFGCFLNDNVALAHARLSILDIEGGIQPIHNEDKSIWIVYNGEVFNFPELKKELLGKGHKFYTSTDTEVIVHLYEEFGTGCLAKLNGQFAFAIWDKKKQLIFAGRDRVGIRPFYYTIQNNVLYFASELKSLFTLDNISRNPDFQTLDQIFTFWTPLPGNTFFKEINELPPANYIVVTKDDISIKSYWQLPLSTTQGSLITNKAEAIEKASYLLEDAAKIRLRADVPVGTYLSGGLDSSGITSIVKNKFNNKLKTYGIRFEEEDFDEGKYQQEMVDYLHVDHSSITISNSEIGENIEQVLWHTEKPILRTSPIPLFMLSKLVHENNYKVVLTGEGADEIFGGYNIFKEAKIRYFWSKFPDSKLRPLLLAKLYPYIFKDSRLNSTLVAFFKYGLDKPDNPFFSHQIRWNNTGKIKNFFSQAIQEEISSNDNESKLLNHLPEEFTKLEVLEKSQLLEIILFLSGYLLSSQGDRVAMAHSVEMRLPFLDHRIIEFMASVSPELKMNGLNEKYLLKEIFKTFLPESIINRAKNPYRAPISNSIFINAKLLNEYLSKSIIEGSGIFNFEKVERLKKKLRNSPQVSETDNMALIGILSAQIIYQKFVQSFLYYYDDNFQFDVLFDERTSNKENLSTGNNIYNTTVN